MEAILGALRHHEVDAVVGETSVALLRVKEAERALHKAQGELEQRVAQRTAELADVNGRLHETIEEQNRIRRQLEESEHKYRELVENANSIILRRDVEGHITFFNEYAQKFFGYSEQEIVGRRAVGTIIPKIDSTGTDRAALFEDISRHPEEHPTSEGEGICREGRRRWIAWTHKPIRDESGRVVEILSVGNDISQLKEATWTLQETERRLLKAQQIARIGNWEIDLETGKVWWSDETYCLLGLEPGQIEPAYETMESFTHPQDRQELIDRMNEAMQGKRPFNMDHRVVRADGTEGFVHSEAEVVFNAAGRPVRIAGIIQCITERRKAQLQLEESASQLQGQAELLDLAHDMIFVHDMEGRIIFWNSGAERCYGWSREEARSQLSHRLLQTEYSEPLIRITAQIVRDGRWEGELMHTTRDGRRITVASRWALRRGDGGRPVAILEIDNDITDRKCAEREMAEAKRFAENIVDTVRECLVVLNPQLRVVSTNRSFREMFNPEAASVEGRLFYTLNKGQWDVPELRRKLQDVVPGGAGFEGFELEYEFADGRARSLTLGARPIHGQAGQPELILVVIHDVTVQKQHEREIRADKEELSALTEELIVTEERQRQKVAAALHDSISQSLAFTKRELVAMKRQAPPGMRESLEQVCDQIIEAISQVRHLTLELAPSILYTLGLEAAIEDLAEQFTACDGFVCHFAISDEPKPLNDEMRSLLYRAVRELLVNVSKHAQASNVSIGIEREGSNIKITVEDDGKGFRPSEPGRRAGKEGGFGIFSIRQRLAHIGGSLLIESAEGKGTKMTLVAPLNLE
jgi:PAS domain S-box-containing protein